MNKDEMTARMRKTILFEDKIVPDSAIQEFF